MLNIYYDEHLELDIVVNETKLEGFFRYHMSPTPPATTETVVALWRRLQDDKHGMARERPMNGRALHL